MSALRSFTTLAMVAMLSTPWTQTMTTTEALSLSSTSYFHGQTLQTFSPESRSRQYSTRTELLTMRKQKASDRRTRRMQRSKDATSENIISAEELLLQHENFRKLSSVTTSPMDSAAWRHKSIVDQRQQRSSSAPPAKVRNAFPNKEVNGMSSGRGRSRKRSMLYSSLASYHNNFLSLLTAEYCMEEAEVLGRIESSIDDPLALEASGHALFDLYPERRGNIFSDEVYRLVKAYDATTTVPVNEDDDSSASTDNGNSILPPNHKFSSNDVVLLTLQPGGSGDFFSEHSLPTNSQATSVEARVLNTGPTYIDVAIASDAFEAAFGPAPNNEGVSGKGDPRMRLRADVFFSNIPYSRMVNALSQITSIPGKVGSTGAPASPAAENVAQKDANAKKSKQQQLLDSICLDEAIRETILTTYTYYDPSSPYYGSPEATELGDLAKRLAKPALQNSPKLANQALGYMQSNPHGFFPQFNAPQLTAIGAALTRRMTLIQGPPGTGKTVVGAAIGFGFVHQCRSVSPHTKVLACAFSNVGADNLAEQLIRLGLKVVRVGKPSGVSKSLWDYTLDAAIDKDPNAQKALEFASSMTLNLSRATRKGKKMKGNSKTDNRSTQVKREAATAAVAASIEACNIAATKALREADVIVSTSVGAADSRLLAACGIEMADDSSSAKGSKKFKSDAELSGSRTLAPDGLPPLSLPFVIVDEACQSVEPGNLIPITASNSCRSLVLLGDPCQLPPTVRRDASGTGTASPLSVSLMARLASALPQPVIVTAQGDKTRKEEAYLNAKPTKQAVSLLRYRSNDQQPHISYRRQFSGSLLLSVQYRMHPSISAFSSAIFYDGLLSSPSFLTKTRSLPSEIDSVLPIENSSIGVRFVDVGGRNNERRGQSSSLPKTLSLVNDMSANTSYRNEAEAHEVISFLKDLLRTDVPKGSAPMTIGIVTPYTSQVALLKSMMAGDSEFRSLMQSNPSSIEVNSVDAYQGKERDLIIFSAVRSNRNGKIGFLKDWRRMNVALTRAKSALVVFGDMETLKAGDKHWEAFGNWCDGVGCVKEIEPSQP